MLYTTTEELTEALENNEARIDWGMEDALHEEGEPYNVEGTKHVQDYSSNVYIEDIYGNNYHVHLSYSMLEHDDGEPIQLVRAEVMELYMINDEEVN